MCVCVDLCGLCEAAGLSLDQCSPAHLISVLQAFLITQLCTLGLMWRFKRARRDSPLFFSSPLRRHSSLSFPPSHPFFSLSLVLPGEGGDGRVFRVPAGGGPLHEGQRDPQTAGERAEASVHSAGSPGRLGQSDRRAGAPAGL